MNTQQCVRCGRGPRADGTFLCAVCVAEPSINRDMMEARLAVGPDGVEQRKWLVAFRKWAGGWPRVRS